MNTEKTTGKQTNDSAAVNYNNKFDEYVEKIMHSELFDPILYRTQLSDEMKSSLQTVEQLARHYLKVGWKKRIIPSILFDGNRYLEFYKDIQQAGLNPLVHYIYYGKAEKRNNFSLLMDIETLSSSILFDPGWYSRQLEIDIQKEFKTKIQLVSHYLIIGWKEGKNPSFDFDGDKYLDVYPDVMMRDVNPLLHYLKRGIEEKRKSWNCSEVLNYVAVLGNVHSCKAKLELDFSLKDNADFTDKKVAIFAAFNEKFCISDKIIYYIEKLHEFVDYIIFISDGYIPYREIQKIKEHIIYCHCETHGEYDFGSYKRGIKFLSNNNVLNDIKELVLCNDSCYGPLYPLSEAHKKMQDVDFWGVTNSFEFNEHIQSYFIMMKNKVFTSNAFLEFIFNVKQEKDVSEVIKKYELRLTQVLKDAGFCYRTLVDARDINVNMCTPNLVAYPCYTIEQGSPFVKVKALTKLPGRNHDGIVATLKRIKDFDTDLYKIIRDDISILKDGLRIDDDFIDSVNSVYFSIILPTYNRRNCIHYAIDSVLNQINSNFELIIVDDGSDDNTEEFIKNNYSKQLKTKRIVYIKNDTNKGVSASRNIGIGRAKYDYIAYIDSDNCIERGFTQLFAEAIAQSPASRTFYAQFCRYPDYITVGEAFSMEKISKGNFIDLGVFVHHIQLFHDFGGFDLKLNRVVDYDVILKYCTKYTPYFIPAPLMIYNNRSNDKRITTSESTFENFVKKKYSSRYVITTIILSYNHEKYIRKSIDSALMQQGDFCHEIIISDDGSTDNTRNIIASYQKMYPHIITDISSDVNVGISENYKRCFAAANGKYLAILEGDDWWLDPFKLQRQSLFLSQNKDCTMCFNASYLFNNESLIISSDPRQDNLPDKFTGLYFVNSKDSNLMLNFSSFMGLTHLLKSLPPVVFNTRLNEISLTVFLSNFGMIGFIKDKLTIYRIRTDSTWNGKSKIDQLSEAISLRESILTYADQSICEALISKINNLLKPKLSDERDKNFTKLSRLLNDTIEYQDADPATLDWMKHNNLLSLSMYLPTSEQEYLLSLKRLIKNEEYSLAEYLCKFGLETFVNDQGIWIQWAHIPAAQNNWDEAYRRYDIVCNKFPSFPEGFYRKIECLKQMQKFGEAESLLKKTQDIFG